jgi:hypothetical protein
MIDRFDTLVGDAYPRQKRMLKRAGVDLDALTGDNHHEWVIKYIGYLTEELFELRCLIPRRYWRNDEKDPCADPKVAKEVSEELADAWIALANLSVVMGAGPDDVWGFIRDKLEYNTRRPDHT